MKLGKFRFLGIIPARVGNQTIKNKNTVIIKKKLIEYTLESSKKSKLLDDIIVSTNSKKIRDISNNLS